MRGTGYSLAMHHHSSRRLLFVVSVTLILLLAACTDGSALPHTWIGVGQTSGGTYAVKLVYTTYGTTLFGTYYFYNSTNPSGKAEGTIDGEIITMLLSNSTTCQFDFAGTVTEQRLTGAFMPRAGCLLPSGTWDLLRQ